MREEGQMKEQLPSPDTALDPYRELVEQNAQAAPMMIVMAAGQPVIIDMECPPEMLSMGRMLKRVAPLINQACPPEVIEWVLFSSEAWMATFPPDVNLDALPPLEVLAEAGDPRVSETIVVHMVSKTDRWAARQKFRRTLDGVQWGEVEVMEGISGMYEGEVPEALAQIAGVRP